MTFMSKLSRPLTGCYIERRAELIPENTFLHYDNIPIDDEK